MLLCGRVHGYEGYPPSEVGFGVRVVAALGVRTLIVTNASGAVEPSLQPGEIVAISDHINLTSASPLSGPNDERLGPRFVDMTDAYDPALRAIAAATAQAATGRPLREAIYAGMAGPAYETPAEVRLLRTLGAGLVGMSTVHEVITARHAGLDVLGLSLVANPAAGVSPGPLRHEDVTRAAGAGADALGPAHRRRRRSVAVVTATLPDRSCSPRRAPSAPAPTRRIRGSASAPPCSTSAAASTPAATSRTRPTASPCAPSATRSPPPSPRARVASAPSRSSAPAPSPRAARVAR